MKESSCPAWPSPSLRSFFRSSALLEDRRGYRKCPWLHPPKALEGLSSHFFNFSQAGPLFVLLRRRWRIVGGRRLLCDWNFASFSFVQPCCPIESLGWMLAGASNYELALQPLGGPPGRFAKAGGEISLWRATGTLAGRQLDGLALLTRNQADSGVVLERSLAILFDGQLALAVHADRPRGAGGHGDEQLDALVFRGEPLEPVTIEKLRLSSTYDGAGVLTHTGLELWETDESELPLRDRRRELSARGELVSPDGVRSDVAFIGWHHDGRRGAGSYVVTTRQQAPSGQAPASPRARAQQRAAGPEVRALLSLVALQSHAHQSQHIHKPTLPSTPAIKASSPLDQQQPKHSTAAPRQTSVPVQRRKPQPFTIHHPGHQAATAQTLQRFISSPSTSARVSHTSSLSITPYPYTTPPPPHTNAAPTDTSNRRHPTAAQSIRTSRVRLQHEPPPTR